MRSRRIWGVVLMAGVLAVWQAATQSKLIDTPSLPPVSVIVQHWFVLLLSGELPRQMGLTLGRMLAGFALASVIAVPLGLLMGNSNFFFGLFEPITEVIRPIPSAAYVPLAILFLGIGDMMKVVVTAVACVFPILLNTYGAVRSVDPVLVDTGRTFGYGRGAIVRKIVLPSILPEVLTGMRISFGIALIVMVVAEMVASNNGMGFFILNTQQFFRIPDMFAGIATLGLVGYLLNASFLKVESLILHWLPQHQRV